MSMRMLANIEAAAEIEYGVKQAGRFEETTIRMLVGLTRFGGIRLMPMLAGFKRRSSVFSVANGSLLCKSHTAPRAPPRQSRREPR